MRHTPNPGSGTPQTSTNSECAPTEHHPSRATVQCAVHALRPYFGCPCLVLYCALNGAARCTTIGHTRPAEAATPAFFGTSLAGVGQGSARFEGYYGEVAWQFGLRSDYVLGSVPGGGWGGGCGRRRQWDSD